MSAEVAPSDQLDRTLGSLVPLAEFAARRRGSVDPKKFPDEVFDLFSIPAYDTGKPERVRGSDIGSTKKVVEPGDVLISRIVPHIQRVWIVPEAAGKRQIASGEWIVFKSSRVVPEFLRHMLLAKPFHQKFMQTVAGMGGSLLRARPKDVERIEIPVPADHLEQRRIAAILDKADAIRRKRELVLKHYGDLRKSVFSTMFGDPHGNPYAFPMVAIRDIASNVRYGTSKKASVEKAQYRVLRMGNLTVDGRLDLSDLKYMDLSEAEVPKYTVEDGDLLFNRTNSRELVGKTAVYDLNEPSAFAGYLIRVRFKPCVSPYYVSGFLNSGYGKHILFSMCKSIIGMANINAQELQNIRLPLPPREEQDRYVSILEKLERTEEQQRRALAECNELCASLSQRAFRGEL